jgi:hypothetical protein
MMKRRTLLQLATAVAAWAPMARLRAFAQAPPFSDEQKSALSAIAEVTLPASIGSTGRAAATQKFIAWHVNYRAGADMGHGYGASTLRSSSPPPVLPRYAAQFAALDAAARSAGAASFAAASIDIRRPIVEAALSTPQPVNRMPARPNGANLIADFMGLYFNSADAFDQAYRAAIGRDDCRSLEGSDQPPAPLAPGGAGGGAR